MYAIDKRRRRRICTRRILKSNKRKIKNQIAHWAYIIRNNLKENTALIKKQRSKSTFWHSKNARE